MADAIIAIIIADAIINTSRVVAFVAFAYYDCRGSERGRPRLGPGLRDSEASLAPGTSDSPWPRLLDSEGTHCDSDESESLLAAAYRDY